MGRFLGITGTPGTGKKTVAPLVADALSLPCFGLNELLTPAERAADSHGVDPRSMRRRLLSRARGRCIVYGHMVPDVLERRDVERVVVLRCDPHLLRQRLAKRGYSTRKVLENVEAELIGVVSASCVFKFGRARVAEYDTSGKDASVSAKTVERLLASSRARGPPVDWLSLYSSAVKLRSLLSEASTESALT